MRPVYIENVRNPSDNEKRVFAEMGAGCLDLEHFFHSRSVWPFSEPKKVKQNDRFAGWARMMILYCYIN